MRDFMDSPVEWGHVYNNGIIHEDPYYALTNLADRSRSYIQQNKRMGFVFSSVEFNCHYVAFRDSGEAFFSSDRSLISLRYKFIAKYKGLKCTKGSSNYLNTGKVCWTSDPVIAPVVSLLTQEGFAKRNHGRWVSFERRVMLIS